MSDDQNIPKIPNMEISKARFLLANGPNELKQQAKDLIMKHVKEDGIYIHFFFSNYFNYFYLKYIFKNEIDYNLLLNVISRNN